MAPVAVSESSAEVPAPSQNDHVGKHDAKADDIGFSTFTPPTFATKEQERQHLKERLAGGIRIFGKFGFDHHIVSHISP